VIERREGAHAEGQDQGGKGLGEGPCTGHTILRCWAGGTYLGSERLDRYNGCREALNAQAHSCPFAGWRVNPGTPCCVAIAIRR
jgi:hypothetical protein